MREAGEEVGAELVMGSAMARGVEIESEMARGVEIQRAELVIGSAMAGGVEHRELLPRDVSIRSPPGQINLLLELLESVR